MCIRDSLYDVRFSTYGVPMIAGEVRRFLRDSSAVRVSRSMRDTAYKVLKAREEFVRIHMRDPSVEEIAKMLDLQREDVVFALDAISAPVSLYDLSLIHIFRETRYAPSDHRER